jgi:hypothetical protein
MALKFVSTGVGGASMGPAGTTIDVSGYSTRHLRRLLDQGVLEVVDAITQGEDVAPPAAMTSTTVAAADVAAAGAVYTQAHSEALRVLANELKADVNALRADVVALRNTVAALEVALSGPGKALA